jgi:ribosome biogenesis GTPase
MNRSGTALVMRSTGHLYTLRDMTAGTVFEAGLRGKLRLSGVRTTNPIAVGDIVDYEAEGDDMPVITVIQPRRNYIIRRASNLSKESHILAANLDMAILVATLFSPETKPEFADRFLVTCEAYGIPVVIALNKADLLAEYEGAADEFHRIYESAGYRVIEVSGITGEGIPALKESVRGKTTLIAGNSGVGKSTLIGAIEPSADAKVADISHYHHKGRHTTTFAAMYPLAEGGYIIDTPGIKGFGLIDIDPRELQHFFPEMMALAPECGYYNCTHTHEPDCAVREALEEGRISESRYISYLKMLEDDEKHRK